MDKKITWLIPIGVLLILIGGTSVSINKTTGNPIKKCEDRCWRRDSGRTDYDCVEKCLEVREKYKHLENK